MSATFVAKTPTSGSAFLFAVSSWESDQLPLYFREKAMSEAAEAITNLSAQASNLMQLAEAMNHD